MATALMSTAFFSMSSVLASANPSDLTLTMEVPECVASIDTLSSGEYDPPTFDNGTSSYRFLYPSASLDWSAGDFETCDADLVASSDQTSSDVNRTLLTLTSDTIATDFLYTTSDEVIDRGSGSTLNFEIEALVSVNKSGTVEAKLTFTIIPTG